MSGGGVPCRPQNGGLQQLLDRIQTVRMDFLKFMVFRILTL